MKQQVAVAAVADVHVGNHGGARGGEFVAGLNQRCRAVIETLRRAIADAEAHRASCFIVLGDLFDVASPSPQVISAVQGLIHRSRIPEFILLLGNHEMVSMQEGDHALGPVSYLDGVQVVAAPTVTRLADGLPLVLVPYQPGDASVWLPEVVHKLAPPRGSVLCLHLGVIHRGTPDYLIAAHDAIAEEALFDLGRRYGITTVLAGNWHERYTRTYADDEGTTTILQVGALAPTGWDNPGLDGYGGVALVRPNGELLAVGTVPGPRFVQVRTEKAYREVVAQARRENADLYVRAVAPADTLREVAKWAVPVPGVVAAVEMLPDGEVARAAAATAAKQARASETTHEAVSRYVDAMQLAEDVDAATVVERALGYLQRVG